MRIDGTVTVSNPSPRVQPVAFDDRPATSDGVRPAVEEPLDRRDARRSPNVPLREGQCVQAPPVPAVRAVPLQLREALVRALGGVRQHLRLARRRRDRGWSHHDEAGSSSSLSTTRNSRPWPVSGAAFSRPRTKRFWASSSHSTFAKAAAGGVGRVLGVPRAEQFESRVYLGVARLEAVVDGRETHADPELLIGLDVAEVVGRAACPFATLRSMSSTMRAARQP